MAKAINEGDEKTQVALLTDRNPHRAYAAVRELAGSYDSFVRSHQRFSQCSKKQPCEHRGCPKCLRRVSGYGPDSEWAVNAAQSSSPSRNYQIRNAQSVQGFHILPENEMWFVTINLEAISLTEFDLKISWWRREIGRVLKQSGLQCIAKGRFEDDVIIAQNLPREQLSKPASIDQFDPDDVVIKLHFHCLFYAFDASNEQVRRALVRSFGSGNVVDVRRIRHDIDEDGKDAFGIEGAARYITKEHLKLNSLNGSSLGRIKEALKFLLNRDRRSTNFSFQAKSFCTNKAKEMGRWAKKCRGLYHLPTEWSFWDIESYLVEANIDEVVHGGVSLDS
tara:strand:+ start:21381 stop:22385 length:1005 start_codon:yes stop_codon:yes gene_type:complete